MSLEKFFQWCYQSPVLGILRDSSYAMPIIQSIHLLGLTILLGTTVMLNLRLLGIGMRQLPLSDVAQQLWPWAFGALLLMISSGILVFIPDPVRYVNSGPFQLKMALLALAILYHFTIFRRVTRKKLSPRSPLVNAIVAFFSLTLWFSVGWAARAIAFFK
jgi:uncharacterized protein DUF6644